MNAVQNQNEKADAILEQEINNLNNYNINNPNNNNNKKYEEEIILDNEENNNDNIYNYPQ